MTQGVAVGGAGMAVLAGAYGAVDGAAERLVVAAQTMTFDNSDLLRADGMGVCVVD